MALTAYVDESCRRRRGESACIYTLVAAIVDDADTDAIRDALRDLREGKAPRLHWHRERRERLGTIAGAVASLPFEGVVAVLFHGQEMLSERARRHCMAPLLRRIYELGTDRVVFESRQEQDRKDMQVLRGWRLAKRPEASMRFDFVPSVAEPVLWLADAVAGAFMWWLSGECDHWSLLEAKTTIVEVDKC